MTYTEIAQGHRHKLPNRRSSQKKEEPKKKIKINKREVKKNIDKSENTPKKKYY